MLQKLWLPFLVIAILSAVAISFIVSVNRTIAAVEGNFPEMAHTYMLLEGLPDNPAETVTQYHEEIREAEEVSKLRQVLPVAIFAVFVVGFFMLFLLVGPEGLTGFFRQVRLTRLAWLRRPHKTGSKPDDDDEEWIEAAHQQQPALPVANTPWLLPAPQETGEGSR